MFRASGIDVRNRKCRRASVLVRTDSTEEEARNNIKLERLITSCFASGQRANAKLVTCRIMLDVLTANKR